MERFLTFSGRDLLEYELSNEFLVSVTLYDRYSSMKVSSRDGNDLMKYIDADAEYSAVISFCNEDYMDPYYNYYNLEIQGRML